MKTLNVGKMREVRDRLLKVQYYSVKLLLLAVGMIQLEANDRIAGTEICQLLAHHEKQIQTGAAFTITKE